MSACDWVSRNLNTYVRGLEANGKVNDDLKVGSLITLMMNYYGQAERDQETTSFLPLRPGNNNYFPFITFCQKNI